MAATCFQCLEDQSQPSFSLQTRTKHRTTERTIAPSVSFFTVLPTPSTAWQPTSKAYSATSQHKNVACSVYRPQHQDVELKSPIKADGPQHTAKALPGFLPASTCTATAQTVLGGAAGQEVRWAGQHHSWELAVPHGALCWQSCACDNGGRHLSPCMFQPFLYDVQA